MRGTSRIVEGGGGVCVRVCERGFKAKKQHDPIPNSSSTTTTGRFTHARRRQRVNDDCLPTMHHHTAAIRRPQRTASSTTTTIQRRKKAKVGRRRKAQQLTTEPLDAQPHIPQEAVWCDVFSTAMTTTATATVDQRHRTTTPIRQHEQGGEGDG